MNFLLQIVFAVAMLFISALLTPRPKQPKAETQELDNPTADAGREIIVVFGTILVESPNIINFGHKRTGTREV